MSFRTIWSDVAGFVRAFRAGPGPGPGRHRGHAVARTLEHGTTLSGGNANTAFGTIGQRRRENLMVEAADRYDSSFKPR